MVPVRVRDQRGKTWPAVKIALKANADVAITLFRKHNT